MVIGIATSACLFPQTSESLSLPQPDSPLDAIVILGNRPPILEDGTLNPELERRVRQGVALFHRGLAPQLLVTGGSTAGSTSEAAVMAAFAQDLGVPGERILREPRAQSTIENARFSLRLLCRATPCQPRVIVVTNRYHAERAVPLFRCAGGKAWPSYSALPSSYEASARSWEWMARVSYWFVDQCERAKPSWRDKSSK